MGLHLDRTIVVVLLTGVADSGAAAGPDAGGLRTVLLHPRRRGGPLARRHD